MVLKLIPIPPPNDPDVDAYMRSRGRQPKPKVARESLPELPSNSSTPISLEDAIEKWEREKREDFESVGYTPDDIDLHWYTTDSSQVETYAEKPYDNTYWSSLALLLYGDSKLWFWIKAQHLSYFEQVLKDETHPRHTLYTKLRNMASEQAVITMGGFSHNTLWKILMTPDLPIRHELVGQVTADLYSIFLVVPTIKRNQHRTSTSDEDGDEHTEEERDINVTDVLARGSPDAPHRFLLFNEDETLYKPLITDEDDPSDFRFPEINLENTEKGLIGVKTCGTTPKENDGPRHPWRRPLEDEPAPPVMVPGPSTPLPENKYLSQVLWVRIEGEREPGPSFVVRDPDGSKYTGAYNVGWQHDYSQDGKRQNFTITVSPPSKCTGSGVAGPSTIGLVKNQPHPPIYLTVNITNNIKAKTKKPVSSNTATFFRPSVTKPQSTTVKEEEVHNDDTSEDDDNDDDNGDIDIRHPGPKPPAYIKNEFYMKPVVLKKTVLDFCTVNKIELPVKVKRSKKEDFLVTVRPILRQWEKEQSDVIEAERREWQKKKNASEQQKLKKKFKERQSSGAKKEDKDEGEASATNDADKKVQGDLTGFIKPDFYFGMPEEERAWKMMEIANKLKEDEEAEEHSKSNVISTTGSPITQVSSPEPTEKQEASSDSSESVVQEKPEASQGQKREADDGDDESDEDTPSSKRFKVDENRVENPDAHIDEDSDDPDAYGV